MTQNSTTRVNLQSAARQSMLEHGFEPDYSPEVLQQVAQIKAHPVALPPSRDARDLRSRLWSSIDNDTSRDLDQIEVAEDLGGGRIKIMVGIADVDALVPKGTPVDDHAARETTSVYTGVHIFSMLPEDLSTDLTSLMENGDRACVVVEFVVDAQGSVGASDAYRAIVRNQAQLAYNGTGAWLEGKGPAPAKVAASAELQTQLKLQDSAAQALRAERFRRGALGLETLEISPVMQGQQIVDVAPQERNHATDLIEEFMIAANGVVARRMQDRKISSIRRIVRTPERWDRIVELAKRENDSLPAQPDSKALNEFLMRRKASDPDHFADLSLAVIKLLGPGEYVLERPGDVEQGHFGLAVRDYTHSTAPNRRFADLAIQRLVKAMLAGAASPYSDAELSQIARNCTDKEDAARRVEREMTKRIAAVAMSSRIGQVFDAVVTGAAPKGTFVRALQAHVEGLLAQGQQGLDVGDRLRVKLIRTDVQHGYIDFARV
jgi:exoribonuclease-2